MHNIPEENTQEKALATVEAAVKQILGAFGEDREGVDETPSRVSKALVLELLSGYWEDPMKHIKTFSSGEYSEIVLLKDIEFSSMCEHHMLPFIGKAHIAYIPSGKVIGVSKLARILDCYAKRLQIQERLCQEVVGALVRGLYPVAAACIIEAKHQCMSCRGVGKQSSSMVTSALYGTFLNDTSARQELMSLISL